ncbi:MAG: ROK family protein [Rhodospirillaceae bacterium]
MLIGIDLGGTKVSALVLDERGGERARLRRPTPTGYAETLDVLAELVAELEALAGARNLPVGLGLPGLVDPVAGTVRAVNLPWLAGHAFGSDLGARLGRPVPMANDANCFTLSEAIDGAAEGAAVVFGAILGTGVGGGIVVNGRCLNGAHGIAGEWGHTPLPWRKEADGAPILCGCGRIGCIETIISGRGLCNLYDQNNETMDTSVAIAQKAALGDTAAIYALNLYFSALARALAFVINFLDPDVIVLGGGVSELPGILNNVSALWGEMALIGQPRTRLVKARFGADSGVRGAARLAVQEQSTWNAASGIKSGLKT